jgi:flagellar L-ring protein precursor FlgH
MKNAVRLLAALSCAAVAGCNGQLDHLGKPPSMSPIENPGADPSVQQVSMPMPAPIPEPSGGGVQTASLWQPGARAFFKDQRASKVGDILTVVIDIDESAKLDNTTSRARDNSDTLGIPHLFGFETSIGGLLPSAYSPDRAVELSSDSGSSGTGKVDRQEQIELQVAATIVDRLPNGNLVIAGKQEIRVNFELRELIVQGIIRPEDITSDNTVSHEKMAEARISYGGRGQITDVQQPRYGQQVLDIVLPY